MLFKNPLLNKSYGEFLGHKNFYMKKKHSLNYPFSISEHVN